MEIDVTHMVEQADDMIALSGSRMEHGQDAGRITWGNSVAYGKEQPLLKTDDERNDARDYFKAFGAWSDEEIAAWSEDELQAIMCQDVAAAIREMEHYETYEEYQKAAEQGRCSGNLFKADIGDHIGRWFFYVGH